GAVLAEGVPGCLAVLPGGDLIAFAPQRQADGLADALLVVDDGDAAAGCHGCVESIPEAWRDARSPTARSRARRLGAGGSLVGRSAARGGHGRAAYPAGPFAVDALRGRTGLAPRSEVPFEVGEGDRAVA